MKNKLLKMGLLTLCICGLAGCGEINETKITSAESTDPVESTEPIESTDPVESTEPVETTDPAESTAPTESMAPVETTVPTEPGSETKQNVSDFELKYGFRIDEIPMDYKEYSFSCYNIDLKIPSNQEIIDQSEGVYEGRRFIDFGTEIDEFYIQYIIAETPMINGHLFGIEEMPVDTFKDKKFKYEIHYDLETNTAALFYPIDDEHTLIMRIIVVDSFKKNGSRIWWNSDIKPFFSKDEFFELMDFDITTPGKLTTDPYEIIVNEDREPLILLGDNYVFNYSEIEEKDGNRYLKNSMMISCEWDANKYKAKKNIEELGREHSFYVVGYIEMSNDFEIVFNENKTLEELEALSEEFMELDWVSFACPEYASGITIDYYEDVE